MRLTSTLFVCAFLIAGMFLPGYSQERYIDEVFTDVTITKNVAYSNNFSIFPAFLGGDTSAIDEFLDIYEPTGDTETSRPLILYAIGGTFLPPLLNQGVLGSREDSANVELAKRMARKGYVVAIVQYRRGWNPLGNPLIQRKTILQAAYRGIQDMRAAARFFRKTEAEDGNPYGINPDKVAVGGSGTGGYMAYGANYLDTYDQTLLSKFFDFTDTANPTPFLDTMILGNPDGTSMATYNIPNNASYSSEFQAGFALGGALGDSSWVEAGDAPFIAMHCERDPGAPYEVGDVIAVDPSNGSPFAVIPGGAGGLAVIRRATRLGNQSIFEGVDWGDPVSDISTAEHPDAVGLYSFDTPFTPGDAMCLGTGVVGDTFLNWSSPWHWWDPDSAIKIWNAQVGSGGEARICQLQSADPVDPVIGRMYLDTIEAFITPRLALALDLGTSVSVNPFISDDKLEVYPNPVRDVLRIRYKDGLKPLKSVRLLDMAGREVRNYDRIDSHEFELMRDKLQAGLYVLQVELDHGTVNKKILLE